MVFESGTRLGHYEILEAIGKGGMGEVWRARDTRLDREVAIKTLPREFATDGDRRARFEREAKLLASLNHPNIGAIYGIEEHAGSLCLILELVDGDTLADRMTGGAISLEESLKLALQIAEALEAAHEKGVIHRDLKPANIKVTPDGKVKVLDFGLAKVFDAAMDSAPTITGIGDTRVGVVVGTPAYMSPEQARGEAVDRRSDIWAFGVVLFEMLTGRTLFQAEGTSATLARVLTENIDWQQLPAGISSVVRYLLGRCLERDPRRRMRDIGEVRALLEARADALEFGTTEVAAVGPAARRKTVMVTLALIVAVLGTSALTWWLSGRGASVPIVTRSSIILTEGQEFSYIGRRALEISDDGTLVVYSAPGGIWARRMGADEPTPVANSHADARNPFVSPDGKSIGYWAVGALWRLPLEGGVPTHLVDSMNPWSAAWGTDGMIFYGQGAGGIWRVPAEGGAAEQMIAVEDGAMAHGPVLLPGGEWVLYTLLPPGAGSWNEAQIVVESLETGERITLIDGGRDARYLPSGYLVFAREHDLFAAAFDAGTLQIGSPERVLVGVSDTDEITGASQFDVSDNGTLVYVPESAAGADFELTWVDRNGIEEATPFEPGAYRHPRVSPRDPAGVVVSLGVGNDMDVMVGDARRGTLVPLVLEAALDAYPIWSSDGRDIVFFSARSGGGLFRRRADGTGPITLLAGGQDWRPTSWTDGGRLVYENLPGAQIHVGTLEDGDEADVLDLVEGSYFDELQPALSPDGRWLAYQSTESGALEIWVRSFPDIDRVKRVVSTDGGASPAWSPDGSEVYYLDTPGVESRGRPTRQPLGSMMAVTIQTEPDFASGTPAELFSLRDYVFPDILGRQYDVAPDGRFLMIKDPTAVNLRPITRIAVVQNWSEELREHLPVD